MESSFAEYILAERDWVKKMEIMYYLKKKASLFFDPSVVFKTLLLKLFLEVTDLEVEQNLALTANLLCNCKKTENPSDLSKVQSYAKDGAEYLSLLGFQDKFCRICEEVNRYSGLTKRARSGYLRISGSIWGYATGKTRTSSFQSRRCSCFTRIS